MIEVGKYPAKITSYVIGETKNGDPQPVISFSVNTGQGQHPMTWYGSFKEGKAREITIKALLTCGLHGNNPAGPIDIGREVMVTIAEETDERNGQVRTKIQWINPLSGPKKVIPQELAKAKLSDLEGAIMAARIDNAKFDDEVLPF